MASTGVSMGMTGWGDRLRTDVRQSVRHLARAPMFAAVAILSLALGIGANTAIFGIIDAAMLKTLPVADPQRLVRLTSDDSAYTNPIWEALRDRQQVLDGLFAWAPQRFNLSTGGEKRLVEGLYVSGRFFESLGVPARVGRMLRDTDDRRSGGVDGPVVVLGHTFWRDRYNAHVSIIGSTIRLDGHPFTIVGVAPPGFFGMEVGRTFDVAVPLANEAVLRGADSALDRRTYWWLQIAGRLKPGQDIAAAQAGLRTVMQDVREATRSPNQRPGDAGGYLGTPVTLVPAATGVPTVRVRYETPLIVLMGAVAIVLLIACANLANLLLARATARRREFAVRLALGAPRSRLIRQVFAESLLLAIAGAAAGLLFARWVGPLLLHQLSSRRVFVHLDLGLDWRLFAFTTGVTLVTALLFGIAPALRSTDLSANDMLKSGSRAIAAGGRRFTLEKALIVVQMALSLVLIVGAALFVRSFTSLATLDPGFTREHVLLMQVDAPRTMATPEERRLLYRRVLEAIATLPGVQAAAYSDVTPISGNAWQQDIAVPGYTSSPGAPANAHMNRVSPGYFETLRTPLRAGRIFDARDQLGAPAVAIVNEAFARRFFRGESPIGRRYMNPRRDQDAGTEIVGVVADSKYRSLREVVPPTIFVPMAQDAQPFAQANFALRAPGDAAPVVRAAVAAVRAVHKDASLEVHTLARQVDDSLIRERMLAMLSGFFGALALLVAGIGLYGVMSLAVARRRHEIGIRIALGARSAAVQRLVLHDAAIVTLLGLAIGTIAALLTGRLVRALLYNLEPTDPSTWLLAVITLTLAAMLAASLPARRAARVDPMIALREE